MNKSEIGLRIRARRKALGLTQTELAQRMGYKSKAAISSVERGMEELTTERVSRYAEALGCTPQALTGWEEETFSRNRENIRTPGAVLEEAAKDGTFVKYAEMLYMLPEDRKRFIYDTIAAQYYGVREP